MLHQICRVKAVGGALELGDRLDQRGLGLLVKKLNAAIARSNRL
jgi:hypothetical protein